MTTMTANLHRLFRSSSSTITTTTSSLLTKTTNPLTQYTLQRTHPIQTQKQTFFQKNFKHTVRVILTQDIHETKQAGEVLTVAAGYARNYLIPQKKAIYAIPKNFERVNILDPALQQESEEERLAREEREGDEDYKAAEVLRYYFRNKTLKIWRNVDMNVIANSVEKGGSGGASTADAIVGASGTPIHPGMVDHVAVRDKLAQQLKIDLDSSEKIQIKSDAVNHATLDDEEGAMERYLDEMEDLPDDKDCEVKLKALGEYLVKIHLAGDQKVGLKLAVVKR